MYGPGLHRKHLAILLSGRSSEHISPSGCARRGRSRTDAVPEPADVTVADVTGGGLKAVCGITRDGFGRGQLRRFTVRHEELSRRLGSWYPVGDLNGDGVHDLVPVEDAPMAAISGSDGSVLWSTNVSGHVHHDFRSTTLVPGQSEDLNGDGSPDVIVLRIEQRREEPEEKKSETHSISKSVVVVQALNGKSGRVLWSTTCVPSDPRTDLSSGGSLYAHLWYMPQPTNLGPNVCLVFKCWGGKGVDDLFVLSGRRGECRGGCRFHTYRGSRQAT